MPISKKIKKILLLTDLVKIEEQEFEEADREYALDFQKDFQKENSFLQETNPEKINQSNEPDGSCLFAIKKEELKKLHKQLVKVTHPDLSKINDDKEFKKIQKAYDDGDGPTLLKEAVARDLPIKVSDETFKNMKKSLEIRRKLIANNQKKVSWLWCQSDKSDQLRSRIRKMMGIDKTAFKEWLKKN